MPVFNKNKGVGNLVDDQIMNNLVNMANQFISFIPTLIAIIVLIIVGNF